jgi:hypothetical protein
MASNDSALAIAGIAALHRADSVATIAHDLKLLTDLWDSAAVRIEPGGPATVSRAAIIANDSAFFARNPGIGVVQYAPHYGPPIINGGSAVEWGYFDAQFVSKVGAAPIGLRGNVLRVLRRQPNGEWRFTHVIMNNGR